MVRENKKTFLSTYIVKCLNLWLLTIFLVSILNGCGWHKTFKQNDRQGQLLPEKAIAQLKSGMSPSEVTHILGSPVLYNINDSRWEYIEYVKVKGELLENKHLILTFENNKLDKIEQY